MVQISTPRVCRLAPLSPDPLVMDSRLMDPASRLNSLGSGVRTQG